MTATCSVCGHELHNYGPPPGWNCCPIHGTKGTQPQGLPTVLEPKPNLNPPTGDFLEDNRG